MPQLRSQQDFANWVTPHPDTIFSHDNEALISEKQIEHIRQVITEILSPINNKALVTVGRSMPNYLLFQIQSETAPISDFCEEFINQLTEQSGWIVGVLPQPECDTTFDILIQTSEHRPMTLHQVLMRPPFRKTESPRSMVLGVTLEQQIIIRDLESLQHLIIAGDKGTTQNIMRGLLLTLLLSNTPSNLRLAFIGDEQATHPRLSKTPHTLGNFIGYPEHGIRLLSGMVREIRRRQTKIQKATCNAILDYNTEYPQTALPHIVLVMDGLDSATWTAQQDKWLNNLSRILRDGSAVGIHVCLVVPDIANDLLHPLFASIQTKVMARAIAKGYTRQINHFDESLWRFVDAIVVEDDVIKPIEVPMVTATDTRAIATYWHKNTEERLQSSPVNLSRIGGITSLFQKLQKENLTPTPPIPQPPTASVLAHAASVLSTKQASQTATSVAHDAEITTQIELEGTKSVTTQVTGVSEEINIQMDMIRRAHALASYLGWLGRGPLMDILGLSLQEAELIIAILQARQILERSNTPTPRLRSSSQTRETP